MNPKQLFGFKEAIKKEKTQFLQLIGAEKSQIGLP